MSVAKVSLDNTLCLLLKCRPDKAEAEDLRQLSPDDWEQVYLHASEHQLAPLIYGRVMKPGNLDAIVPENTVARFRHAYLAACARNMALYDQLGTLLGRLEGAGVPVIVLKGGHLAEAFYQDIGLRTFTDVDILVRKEDLARAWREVRRWNRTEFAGGLFVEVHWNLGIYFEHLEMDMEGVWQRARPVVIAGSRSLGLAPEDLVLHLVLHLAFHYFAFRGLGALCDIREVLERTGGAFSWNGLFHEAESRGAERLLLLTLSLAQELVDAPVPKEAQAGAKPLSGWAEERAWMREQLFSQEDRANQLSANFWRLLTAGPLRRRLRALRDLLFPTPEHVDADSPIARGSSFQHANYLFRFKEYLAPYATTLARLLTGHEDTQRLADQQKQAVAMIDRLCSGGPGQSRGKAAKP